MTKNRTKSNKLGKSRLKNLDLNREKYIINADSEYKIGFNTLRNFQKTNKITTEDLIALINLPKESIPVSIFKSDLPPLEAIALYLKKSFEIKEISSILNRSQKTIWTTLKNASRKKASLDESGIIRVPINIFAERKLSVLENLTKYLRETKNLKLINIANITGKDRRLIWTVYNRAKKKELETKRKIRFTDISYPIKLIELDSQNREVLHSIREIARHLTTEDLAKIINLPKESVPASIFKSNFSPLESVTTYLNQYFNKTEIGRILGRSEKTIWTTLKNASKKKAELDESSHIRIPLNILADRRLSILENAAKYLKEEYGLKLTEIGKLLGKDRRLVWTVYNRAKKKRTKEDKIKEDKNA